MMINNSMLIRINANGNNDKFQNIAALGIRVLFRDDLDLNSNFQENIRIVPFAYRNNVGEPTMCLISISRWRSKIVCNLIQTAQSIDCIRRIYSK